MQQQGQPRAEGGRAEKRDAAGSRPTACAQEGQEKRERRQENGMRREADAARQAAWSCCGRVGWTSHDLPSPSSSLLYRVTTPGTGAACALGPPFVRRRVAAVVAAWDEATSRAFGSAASQMRAVRGPIYMKPAPPFRAGGGSNAWRARPPYFDRAIRMRVVLYKGLL